MKHEDLWRALDTLAAEKGLSTSGLARAAGLDPTAFNRSKRNTHTGPRWPSTESLARVLSATGASLETFTTLVGGARALTVGRTHRARNLPLLPLSRLDSTDLFDRAGYPSGPQWEETEVPQPGDPNGYAVRVDSDGLEPVFREGGTVIVSPDAPVRPGDRVLMRRLAGAVQACIVTARTPQRVEFGALGALGAAGVRLSCGIGELAWLHRIVWASL